MFVRGARNGAGARSISKLFSIYSQRDVNTPQLAASPCLSDLNGRLSGHFPAAACRRDLSDTPQLAAAEISL